MAQRRVDLAGLSFFVGAGALWLARDEAAWAATTRLPGFGFPLLSLLVHALAVLFAAVAIYRLREVLGALVASILARVDAVEDRLETLPPRRARAFRAVGVGVVVAALIIPVFGWARIDDYLETRALDLFFKLRFPERSQAELATGRALPSAVRQEDVVVVAVDDESITRLGWPMPRFNYARLIDVVSAAKPASLTFDVSLVDPSREHPEWDTAVGDAVRRSSNVTFTFTIARLTGESRPTMSEPALRALDANSIPWHDSAASLPEYTDLVGGDAAPNPVVDPVARSAHAIAMANVLLDGGDDVLRHSLLVARLRDRLLPSLSLRIAAQHLGVPLSAIRIVPGSHVDLGGKRRIPIDRLGRTRVRYQGRHDTRGDGPVAYVPLWSLVRADSTLTLTGNPLGEDQRFKLDDQTKVTRDGLVVPLSSIDPAQLAAGAVLRGTARYSPDPGRILELEFTSGSPALAAPDFEMVDEQTLKFATTIATTRSNGGDPSSLTGKHVFVGSTALAAADLRTTPLGELPGVEHHATMLANLLRDDFFHQAPGWVNALVVVLAALVAAAVGVSLSTGAGLLLNALLVLTLLTTSFLLSSSGLHVPAVSPSLAVVGSSVLCLIMGGRAARRAHAKSESEREFVRQTFGRYLTEQVVQALLDSPDGLRLGGQRGFVTIMMTDLRGFTSMCGSMEPEDVVKLLNHYLESMTRIIARYGGTIDEFIGDAILVVFGAPLPLQDTEKRAVACAIEMLNAMPEINRWNASHELPEVEMGIGVHSGEVVLGNIGSELRAKYGIVGATINLTSRVESFTVGGQVLISEQTRERCGDALTLGTSQVVSPKGVKGTMTIHEALAVGAPFDVKLQTATEELVTPKTPIELRYATIKSKQVGELTHVAHVEALSELGLELKVDEDLPTLSDLQLRVVEGGALRNGDLYGKVLKTNVRPNVVYLRLTSVAPELKALLEAARGGAAPVAPVIAESVLVTS
ncbi:MAG: adenylate/guanylate cyclase domain-containing protein [Myxococcales bacterium]|nr:adenylate/guanylate cyclase domain-containing protein [Myxococcales bacterium]